MSFKLPRHRAQGGSALFLLLASTMALAGCGERAGEAPLGPAAVLTAVLSPLDVTVEAPDGRTPVAGVTVRAYGIREDGTLGPVGEPELTGIDGKVILDLPEGNYCLSARTAPPEWVNGLDIVTPPTPFEYTPVEVAYGPVVTGRREYVPVNQANFDYCLAELPVRLSRNGSRETVRMVSPFNVHPSVRGLDGEPLTDVDVFAVIPINVPWGPSPNAEIKSAFFSVVDFTNLPAHLFVSTGAPFALEFQTGYNGFNITGTVKGTGGQGGETSVLTMEAAPLMCHQSTQDFPAGAPGIDFLKVNYGYHASLALTPDPSMVAVQVKHAGNGPVTVTFRTDLPNGRWTTTVDFACADGNCGPASVQNSGGNTQTAKIFHAEQLDGTLKTSIVLGGIPATHTSVLFAAKSPGDAIPLASRDVATDAFFVVPRPAQCVIQQSNDDKWAIGDL